MKTFLEDKYQHSFTLAEPDLLIHTDLPIIDIAFEKGFESANYFTIAFFNKTKVNLENLEIITSKGRDHMGYLKKLPIRVQMSTLLLLIIAIVIFIIITDYSKAAKVVEKKNSEYFLGNDLANEPDPDLQYRRRKAAPPEYIL